MTCETLPMSKQSVRTARHRRVARELGHLREEAGLTLTNAASLLGVDRSVLSRWESAESMPTQIQVSQILGTYGGQNQGRRLAILELFKHVREPGWWVNASDIIDGAYADLETAADRFKAFNVQLVHGIFQDTAYARALIEGFTDDPQEQRRRLNVRRTRQQEVLDRPKPPEVDLVLTEAVLDNQVGGPAVMRKQLEHLLELIDTSPNVSIRVIPWVAGAYPMIGHGSITIFEFDGLLDLDTAYVETFPGAYYVEETSAVKRCTDMFQRVADVALDGKESRALIAAKV